MSVPGDTNRITVQINVKDQNGTEVKIDTEKEEQDDKKDDEKKEDEDKEGESDEKKE